MIAKSLASLRKKELRNSRTLTYVKNILPPKDICIGFRNLCTHKSVQDAAYMICRYYKIPIMKTAFHERVLRQNLQKCKSRVLYCKVYSPFQRDDV